MANKCVQLLFSFVRSIPVIFVTTIVVWSYYAYTIQLCLFNIEYLPEKILFLTFYHIILFFFCWSFWVTVFTPVAVPPFEYNLASSEEVTRELLTTTNDRKKIINNFGKSLGVQCRLINGDVRFCDKCNAIKPDRAHHCSVCGKCILKLDHHCPWVNNCVCFSNYKFFFLFLVYGLLYCLYIFATTFKYFIIFWEGVANTISTNMGNLHVVFLFFISAMFFISICVLLSYHVYLVALNRSTIEAYQTPMFANGVKDEHAFNLGYKANFHEIFGKSPKLWFLPIFSSFGDGLRYPMRHPPISSNYNTMESVLNIANEHTTSINIYDNSGDINKLVDSQQGTDDKHMLLNDTSVHAINNRDVSIVSDYSGF